jgi:hypothetical protein
MSGTVQTFTSGGVSYQLTLVNPGLLESYTLVVTDVSGTSLPITGIGTGSVVLTQNGTVGGLVGLGDFVIPPTFAGTFNPTVALGPITLYVGGTAIIDPAVELLAGTTINVQGGTATLATGVAAGLLGNTTVNIVDGGTFSTGTVLASVLNGTTVNFGVGGGTFTANDGVTLLNLSSTAITGFTVGTDKIELENLPPGTLTSYNVSTASGGVQTITFFSGAVVLGSVAVTGSNITPGTVDAGSFGPLTVTTSGSDLIFDPVGSTLCFLGGTLIATPDGEAAVETMKPGDLVLTADGRAVPVRWIGINTVSTRFADPLRTMPIRISAGALGEGLPLRDLLISPDHGLLLGGILAQAGALVDGLAIRREMHMPEVFRYYHIEIAAHDLILAEAVPVETFVDNVSRMSFDNWEEFLDLCGGEPPTGEMPYPRAKSSRQLPVALRQGLRAIADRLQAQTAA